MGTRADYYIGKGKDLRWLGSTAYDGCPDWMPKKFLRAKTEEEYLAEFNKKISTRDDFTSPEQGWPWPWEDSHTTDYAYTFFEGKVWACNNCHWFDPIEPPVEFPDMTQIQNVTLGERSGLMILAGIGDGK